MTEQQNKANHTFFSMMLLSNIIVSYSYDLNNCPIVSGKVKDLSNKLKNWIVSLQKETLKRANNGAEIWNKEITQRDNEVYSNIFFLLNEMNDKQRDVVEQLVIEYSKGNIKEIIEPQTN